MLTVPDSTAMPDVFTKQKRSEVMSRIRSRGNKDTELRLVAVFRFHHFTGWRRHVSLRFPGEAARTEQPLARSEKAGQSRQVRPDFVFRHQRLAVFVDGCFWHGCPLHGTKPKQNGRFWAAKIQRNQERDALVTRSLRKAGWRVLRIWEHELTKKNERRLVARLRRWLRSPE